VEAGFWGIRRISGGIHRLYQLLVKEGLPSINPAALTPSNQGETYNGLKTIPAKNESAARFRKPGAHLLTFSVMACQSFFATRSLVINFEPMPTQATPALNQAARLS
jgi:hypothetical protein